MSANQALDLDFLCDDLVLTLLVGVKYNVALVVEDIAFSPDPVCIVKNYNFVLANDDANNDHPEVEELIEHTLDTVEEVDSELDELDVSLIFLPAGIDGYTYICPDTNTVLDEIMKDYIV